MTWRFPTFLMATLIVGGLPFLLEVKKWRQRTVPYAHQAARQGLSVLARPTRLNKRAGLLLTYLTISSPC